MCVCVCVVILVMIGFMFYMIYGHDLYYFIEL